MSSLVVQLPGTSSPSQSALGISSSQSVIEESTTGSSDNPDPDDSTDRLTTGSTGLSPDGKGGHPEDYEMETEENKELDQILATTPAVEALKDSGINFISTD